MRQFLTLVDDTEEEETEESIDRLFQCLDESSSSSGSSESKRPKKKKKSNKGVKKDHVKNKKDHFVTWGLRATWNQLIWCFKTIQKPICLGYFSYWINTNFVEEKTCISVPQLMQEKDKKAKKEKKEKPEKNTEDEKKNEEAKKLVKDAKKACYNVYNLGGR